jgi:hypothetical protein
VTRSKNDCDRPTVNPANCMNARSQNGLKAEPAPVVGGVVVSAPKRM